MTQTPVPFRKMNGLGNDFVVLDARAEAIPMSDEIARVIADREDGVGCDQLIVMEPSRPGADVFMRIRNWDGAEVSACGNATRCVAAVIASETGRADVTVETNAGLLPSRVNGDGTVTVDMGAPKFGWDDIPLSEEFRDTRAIELEMGPPGAPLIHSPSVVNVGNPHAIFWVDDLDVVDLSKAGPLLENHPLFPERANISLARVDGPDQITVRVWERGVGLTRACGTAACAVAVAAARTKRTGRSVTIVLPGGPLRLDWREDDHILMTGPWADDGPGLLDPAFFA
ncbi:MAG: diaminopimelate epimerase [Pseudomonadota bacterium]